MVVVWAENANFGQDLADVPLGSSRNGETLYRTPMQGTTQWPKSFDPVAVWELDMCLQVNEDASLVELTQRTHIKA